jgi:hypothetical protein
LNSWDASQKQSVQKSPAMADMLDGPRSLLGKGERIMEVALACWNAQNMYPNDPAGGEQWWQNKHQADAARILGTR